MQHGSSPEVRAGGVAAGPVRTLVVATGNPHKLDELRAMLADLPLRVAGLGDLPPARRPEMPEETGATFEENADLKAVHVARAAREWALADNSGFEVPALEWRPGVFSARYAGVAGERDEVDLANNRKLIAEARRAELFARAKPPEARFRCVLSVARPDGRVLARGKGTIDGVLVEVARGTGGFGYDPHFLVPALGRTFAEIRPEEKNRVSHRASAMSGLRRALERLLAPATGPHTTEPTP